MITLNVSQTKSQLSHWLDKVEQGEEIQIVRRGKPVAVLSPAKKTPRLPNMKTFRDSIQVSGPPSSEIVQTMRDEERF